MRKEFIKSNEVKARTLFVGVGGIGSQIVTKVAEMCRPGETDNVNFVCLDTNVNDLRDVLNSKAKLYYVQTSSSQTVGDYLGHDKDAMTYWFPKNNVLFNKTVSEGAGQVRAISRLALNATIKNGNINELIRAIDDLFRKDGEPLQQALRVTIVSSASGGTGSGIVLPLSMYIRNYIVSKYPNTGLIIRSMLLLPETLDNEIKSNTEKENQRRNAYATIKEMNAFMMKGTGIFDTDPSLNRYKDLCMEFTEPGTNELLRLDCLPCDFCFLLDGQNTEDNTLNSKAQYIEQAAKALYEQNIGPMQRDAISIEDNIIREFCSPGNFARNRFGGIGASTIVYPYETIADYVAYGWAIDSIGGSEEASKWSRYDKAYDVARRKAKNDGLPESEWPKRRDVYTATMLGSTDKFSKSLVDMYKLNDVVATKIPSYVDNLMEHMFNKCVINDPKVSVANEEIEDLRYAIDYNDDGKRGTAEDNLKKLRDVERLLSYIEKKAGNDADLLFKNEQKTALDFESYMIEALLKCSDKSIMHQNAMRFVLYELEKCFAEKIEFYEGEVTSLREDLARYSVTPDASKTVFEANNERYCNIDKFIEEDEEYSKQGAIAKTISKKDDEYYDVLNTAFMKMHEILTELETNIVSYQTIRSGLSYIKMVNAQFEKFYNSFSSKVVLLEKRREDLVEDLKYRKGDSDVNICSRADILEELERTTTRIDTENMLDSELCGKLFDAIKANVRFEEETKHLDVIEENGFIDLFDTILLKYFKEDVRANAEGLDMNIIEAIARENRLIRRIKLREMMGETDEKIVDNVTAEDDLEHINEVISRGRRLAAPGIQPVAFSEKREIPLCAYNKSLDNMKGYRIDKILDGRVATDTISSYEIHFFTALYNLTPDRIDKFCCEKKEEVRVIPAGLYHKAYVDYSKTISPDSMKELKISTHIDKRWDSIAKMPELDMDYNRACIMRVHQTMMYGFIYKCFKYKPISNEEGSGKKYVYIDDDCTETELITQNGSVCDEFYEVLDALYINPMVVSELEDVKNKYVEHDKEKNTNYENSSFKLGLNKLAIECFHGDDKTPISLFEVPFVYYNSLPSSLRSHDEIVTMIDAVINIFLDEITSHELESSIKTMMGKELKSQFELLVENYKKYTSVSRGIDIANNDIMDIVFRKVRKYILEESQLKDAVAIIDEMETLLGK